MASKFIESGSSATQGTQFYNGGPQIGGTGAITSDAQAIFSSVRSIKVTTGASNGSAYLLNNPAGLMADAGRRFTFGFRFTGTPSPSGVGSDFVTVANFGAGLLCFRIGITAAGKLCIMVDNAATSVATGTTVLTASTDYRISCTYVLTSTTVNSITVYLNGVSEVTATNTTLASVGSSAFLMGTAINGNTSGSNLSFFYAHIYIDDGTAGDVGNIRVTAKRPFANGTTNGFTTQIGSGGSGYGTGHAPQVNERPLSITNGWSIASVGSAITEEYNIEGLAVGDNDLTGATITDYTGWVYTKALIAETGSIIVNNVSSNISITTAAALFTKIAGSSTYPAGAGKDIGEITSTTVTTVSLYEAGIVVAYIPAVAGAQYAPSLTTLGA